MQVDQFITETLIRIARAIATSRAVCSEHGCTVAPTHDQIHAATHESQSLPVQLVNFDLAVHASESSGADGKGSLEVLSVLRMGGSAKSASIHKASSRVQFAIPMLMNTAPIDSRDYAGRSDNNF